MNSVAKHILEIGVFFAGAVMVLDALLFQLPILDWLALGIVFFFAAVSTLISIARTIPFYSQRSQSISQTENDLEHLTGIVEAAVHGGDGTASRILSDEIKSLILGEIALRAKIAKREVINLLENHPENLQRIIRDDKARKFLADYRKVNEDSSEEQLEKILSEIGS